MNMIEHLASCACGWRVLLPGAHDVVFTEALRVLRAEYERVLAENKSLRPIGPIEQCHRPLRRTVLSGDQDDQDAKKEELFFHTLIWFGLFFFDVPRFHYSFVLLERILVDQQTSAWHPLRCASWCCRRAKKAKLNGTWDFWRMRCRGRWVKKNT